MQHQEAESSWNCSREHFLEKYVISETIENKSRKDPGRTRTSLALRRGQAARTDHLMEQKEETQREEEQELYFCSHSGDCGQQSASNHKHSIMYHSPSITPCGQEMGFILMPPFDTNKKIQHFYKVKNGSWQHKWLNKPRQAAYRWSNFIVEHCLPGKLCNWIF